VKNKGRYTKKGVRYATRCVPGMINKYLKFCGKHRKKGPVQGIGTRKKSACVGGYLLPSGTKYGKLPREIYHVQYFMLYSSEP